MKHIIWILAIFALIANICFSQDAAVSASQGLDLQSLAAIVKQSRNAQDIENTINQPGSINNLDLDGDGQVDYIHVTEYAKDNICGFSFYVDNAVGQKQEVATVEIQNHNNTANVVIVGNNDVYGPGYAYTAAWVVTDFMLWNYLWAPHTYYYSPYRYGYYPTYYHYYRPVPYRTYHSNTNRYNRTVIIHKTEINNYRSHSPNTTYRRTAPPVRENRNVSPPMQRRETQHPQQNYIAPPVNRPAPENRTTPRPSVQPRYTPPEHQNRIAPPARPAPQVQQPRYNPPVQRQSSPAQKYAPAPTQRQLPTIRQSVPASRVPSLDKSSKKK